MAVRVASRHVQALYWAAPDRHYQATREEIASGVLCCPRDGKSLVSVSYKREQGRSVRLLACPKCLFLVKPDQVLR